MAVLVVAAIAAFYSGAWSSPAILFSEFSSFRVGNKDLKPRTGSWRVVKILTAAWGSILVVGSILIWLGLANPRDYWWFVTIALPFVLIGFVYVNLYKLPPKKHATTSPSLQLAVN